MPTVIACIRVKNDIKRRKFVDVPLDRVADWLCERVAEETAGDPKNRFGIVWAWIQDENYVVLRDLF